MQGEMKKDIVGVGEARERMVTVLSILQECDNLAIELVGREPEVDCCEEVAEFGGNIGELRSQIEVTCDYAIRIRKQLERAKEHI